MTQIYALWEPGRPLEFRRMSYTQFGQLVGGRHGATVGVSLYRHGGAANLLKVRASDVAMLFPDDYGAHTDAASQFVEALGGTQQPWAGVLGVYGIDSVEGGFPESLTEHQREVITAAYVAVTGTQPVDATGAGAGG